MTIVSWLISLIIFIIIIVVMMWCRTLVKDVSSYLVGGRKQRVWLGLSNTFSGGLGLVTIAYIAQQGFNNGFSYLWIILIQSIYIIIMFGIFGFGIQRLRATKAMTAGQFHEMRYSRGVRLLVGWVSGIAGVVNMAAFPVVGATYLIYFLDLPLAFSIGSVELSTIPVIMGTLICVGLFFTVISGQVGSIATDYLQAWVVMIGLFSVTFLIFRNIGVISIRDSLQESLGNIAFNPFLSGTYGWQWVLWLLCMATLAPFSSPNTIAKNAATKNSKVTRVTTLYSTMLANGKQMIMLTLGIGAMIVLGKDVPEGMQYNEYSLTASAIYLGRICGPVLFGILFSALLAAHVSTDNTYFLTWSGVWVNDVICPLLPKPLSTKAHLLLLRMTAVCIGIFLFIFGVLYKTQDTILEFVMITGTMWLGCGIAAVVGLYWKRACTAAAYAAILNSLVLPICHLILQKIWPFYQDVVETKTAGIITIGISFFLMIIISLIYREPTKFIDYSGVVKDDEARKL
ncbi:MAG: hypothetical protein WC959_06295 [Kiritimatiellales bacterium]